MFVKTQPADSTSSTFGLLWPFEQTRQLKPRHVYLGYWIERSPKMAYKAQFKPQQVLVEGRWVSPPPVLPAPPPGR